MPMPLKSYEQFLEGSNDALIIVDRDNVIIFLNKAAIQLLNQPEKFVLGQNLLDVLCGECAPFIRVATHFIDGAIVNIVSRDSQNNFSVVIHQLKAPLAALKWTIEDILEDDYLNAHQKEQLNDLYKTNQFLINLVNDLLSVYKFETDKLEINRIKADLRKLIADMINMLQPSAARNQQKIVFKSEYDVNEVFIDPNLFTLAFESLLDNAITYAAKNSDITINITRGDKAGDYIISVHNTGSVINEEDKPKIFSRFYRADAAKKIKPNGSGLGLYIAKLAAEANGGRIWFESSVESGTIFNLLVSEINN